MDGTGKNQNKWRIKDLVGNQLLLYFSIITLGTDANLEEHKYLVGMNQILYFSIDGMGKNQNQWRKKDLVGNKITFTFQQNHNKKEIIELQIVLKFKIN